MTPAQVEAEIRSSGYPVEVEQTGEGRLVKQVQSYSGGRFVGREILFKPSGEAVEVQRGTVDVSKSRQSVVEMRRVRYKAGVPVRTEAQSFIRGERYVRDVRDVETGESFRQVRSPQGARVNVSDVGGVRRVRKLTKVEGASLNLSPEEAAKVTIPVISGTAEGVRRRVGGREVEIKKEGVGGVRVTVEGAANTVLEQAVGIQGQGARSLRVTEEVAKGTGPLSLATFQKIDKKLKESGEGGFFISSMGGGVSIKGEAGAEVDAFKVEVVDKSGGVSQAFVVGQQVGDKTPQQLRLEEHEMSRIRKEKFNTELQALRSQEGVKGAIARQTLNPAFEEFYRESIAQTLKDKASTTNPILKTKYGVDVALMNMELGSRKLLAREPEKVAEFYAMATGGGIILEGLRIAGVSRYIPQLLKGEKVVKTGKALLGVGTAGLVGTDIYLTPEGQRAERAGEIVIESAAIVGGLRTGSAIAGKVGQDMLAWRSGKLAQESVSVTSGGLVKQGRKTAGRFTGRGVVNEKTIEIKGTIAETKTPRAKTFKGVQETEITSTKGKPIATSTTAFGGKDYPKTRITLAKTVTKTPKGKVLGSKTADITKYTKLDTKTLIGRSYLLDIGGVRTGAPKPFTRSDVFKARLSGLARTRTERVATLVEEGKRAQVFAFRTFQAKPKSPIQLSGGRRVGVPQMLASKKAQALGVSVSQEQASKVRGATGFTRTGSTAENILRSTVGSLARAEVLAQPRPAPLSLITPPPPSTRTESFERETEIKPALSLKQETRTQTRAKESTLSRLKNVQEASVLLREQTRQGTLARQRSKATQQERLFEKQVGLIKTTPLERSITRTRTQARLRTSQITRQVTSARTGFPSLIIPTIMPFSPQILPPVFRLGGGFGFGEKDKKKKKKFRYVPDVFSITFGLKGKVPKYLAGAGARRPII